MVQTKDKNLSPELIPVGGWTCMTLILYSIQCPECQDGLVFLEWVQRGSEPIVWEKGREMGERRGANLEGERREREKRGGGCIALIKKRGYQCQLSSEKGLSTTVSFRPIAWGKV